MKKFLFILMGLIVAGNALGECKVVSCSAKDGINGWVTADYGGNQCWFCGPGFNSCNHFSVVPYYDGVGDVVGLYQCVHGVFTNSFKNFEPGQFCQNSDLQHANGLSGVELNNAKKTYSLVGSATAPKELGDWNVFEGSASCIMLKCNPNYVPNAEKTRCVKPETLCSGAQVYENGKCVEKESGCKLSGGTWKADIKKCDCSKSPNTTPDATGYVCECKSGYEWNDKNDHSKGCYDVAAAEQNKTNKEKCESTGGEWKNNACSCDVNKNLTKNGDVCECKSSDYQYNAKQKKCIITDVAKQKEACAKISDATWGEASNKCVCRDPMQEPDLNRLVCVYPDGYEACKAKSGVADWKNGGCVCKQSGYIWNGDDCQKSEATIAAEEIDNVYAEIDTLTAKYATKISKWKDAEGNFNTARLASDSIAGVVLGTVGGVVTSTVIKKNQIEDGFEDLKCAIGGQTVATWGDEFVVGVQ